MSVETLNTPRIQQVIAKAFLHQTPKRTINPAPETKDDKDSDLFEGLPLPAVPLADSQENSEENGKENSQLLLDATPKEYGSSQGSVLGSETGSAEEVHKTKIIVADPVKHDTITAPKNPNHGDDDSFESLSLPIIQINGILYNKHLL